MSKELQPIDGSKTSKSVKQWLQRWVEPSPETAREIQLRYLSQSIRLEETVNPRVVRGTVILVSAAVAIFLIWAGLTNINEVARAPGEIVPVGYERAVQHLEGGTIEEILVTEGEYVAKGQPLVKLAAIGHNEDIAVVQEKIRSLNSEAERYRAFLEGRQPDFSKIGKFTDVRLEEQLRTFDAMVKTRIEERKVLEDQLEQKRKNLGLIAARRRAAEGSLAYNSDLARRRRQLFDKGLTSFTRVASVEDEANKLKEQLAGLAEEKARAESEIVEYEGRISALVSKQNEEIYNQLLRVESEREQNKEMLQKLTLRAARLTMRAPTEGIIKGVEVNTVGAVVQPGQTLVTMVPTDEPLIVQTRVSPRDVGHIAVGQPVQLKVSAYDFSRYGWLSGRLDFISVNTFTDPNGERYYRARIKLDKRYVGPDPNRNPILPGMTVTSEIITGEKTILAYMLKPVQVALDTSFSER